jgi:xylitol oxidase
VADTTGDLVCLTGLPSDVDVAADRTDVTVPSGMRYGELAARLHEAGLGLHNLGSLPHIGVAGACATGTHGSGAHLGNLATAVSGLELVTASGELVRLHRDDAGLRLAGAIVSLGCLGVVTRLTLDVQPTYDIRQLVYEHLPLDTTIRHFDVIMSSAYSVSLFTTWRESKFEQVWLKQRLGVDDASADPKTRWGARLADGPRHPIPGLSPAHCTEQGGVPGPWHTRLPHFRLDFTPSAGAELQSEYLLPRSAAAAALSALDAIRDRVAAVLQVCEIRTVAADDLWLSPSYGRDCVAVHFTWVLDLAAVQPVIALVEERLGPLSARPHWGKLFSMPVADVAAAYERISDFRRLRADFDPLNKFGNEFVDALR